MSMFKGNEGYQLRRSILRKRFGVGYPWRFLLLVLRQSLSLPHLSHFLSLIHLSLTSSPSLSTGLVFTHSFSLTSSHSFIFSSLLSLLHSSYSTPSFSLLPLTHSFSALYSSSHSDSLISALIPSLLLGTLSPLPIFLLSLLSAHYPFHPPFPLIFSPSQHTLTPLIHSLPLPSPNHLTLSFHSSLPSQTHFSLLFHSLLPSQNTLSLSSFHSPPLTHSHSLHFTPFSLCQTHSTSSHFTPSPSQTHLSSFHSSSPLKHRTLTNPFHSLSLSNTLSLSHFTPSPSPTHSHPLITPPSPTPTLTQLISTPVFPLKHTLTSSNFTSFSPLKHTFSPHSFTPSPSQTHSHSFIHSLSPSPNTLTHSYFTPFSSPTHSHSLISTPSSLL
ncbi:hypothetical protein C7M84_008551 [Penaeus vannamei]|uniref:Uncharacterized protein n=1 Tax=Penaeus vannamei TaxID=6689 RepID=A0A3R7M645_PENVA|nr:hypothetical protein C7M84_008551 [Penaeus vannamei]